MNGRLHLVQALLDAGANVNMLMDSGEAALSVAASSGLNSISELFLDRVYAVRQGDCIPCLLLMEKVYAKGLLGKALACSSSPSCRGAAKLLFETCLVYHKTCCKLEDLSRALAREMEDLKKGADIQVKLLLDQGAEPNIGVPDDERKTSREPVLCYLMKSNKFEDEEMLKKVIGLLLDHGANTTKRGPHGCPIDAALRARRWELVGILRDRGVDKTQMYRFMEAKVNRELRRLEKERVKD